MIELLIVATSVLAFIGGILVGSHHECDRIKTGIQKRGYCWISPAETLVGKIEPHKENS